MKTYWTWNLLLQRALHLAATRNIPQQDILAAAGLSEEEAWKPEGRIPTGKLVGAVELAAELTGMSDFGLQWGAATDHHSFGVLGVVASHHDRLSSALSAVGEFLFQMETGYAYVVRQSGADAIMNYAFAAESERPPRHFVEGNVMWMVCFARLLSNGAWAPSRVTFTHDRIGPVSQYEDAFACAVAFNQPMNAVVSPWSVIDRPLSIKQTPLQEMVAQTLEGRTARDEEHLPDRIGQLLDDLLPSGMATADQVATLLSMSPRTLQRRLASHGTTFKDIVNRKREEIVGDRLSRGAAKGEDLALALGFSEPSAASRFIRKYHGTTARQLKSQVRSARRVSVERG